MNRTGGDYLVAQVSDLIDQYSAEKHDLVRRLDALRRARTELRLGRSPAVVLPLLEQEVGEPFETMMSRRQAASVISPAQTR